MEGRERRGVSGRERGRKEGGGSVSRIVDCYIRLNDAQEEGRGKRLKRKKEGEEKSDEAQSTMERGRRGKR